MVTHLFIFIDDILYARILTLTVLFFLRVTPMVTTMLCQQKKYFTVKLCCAPKLYESQKIFSDSKILYLTHQRKAHIDSYRSKDNQIMKLGQL